jgi:hypothetical protein
MSNNVVFLYKIKDTDDRDAFAYIEDKPLRFECGHYFGSISLCGAAYSGSDFADYADIVTILTEDEYDRLIAFDKAITDLGYGIKIDDARYKRGIELCESVSDIYDKLNGAENAALFDSLWEEEKEYMYNEYGLDDEDCEAIAAEYPLEYRDRAMVSCVFDSVKDCGYEEAQNFGHIPEYLENYIDYESFGRDLINDSDSYFELSDGRVVYFNQ